MQLLVSDNLYHAADSMAAMLFPYDEYAQAQARDAVLHTTNREPLPGDRAGWRPGTRLVVVR